MILNTRLACVCAYLLLTAILSIAMPVTAAEKSAAIPFKKADVIALAEKVADYQLATMAGGALPNNASPDTPNKTGWVQGALFVGLTELADHSDNPAYRQAIISRGQANKWQLGSRVFHADDHVIGQAYLWAAQHGAGLAAISPLQKQFDKILAFPPTVGLAHRDYSDPRGVDCDQRWCWSDAIFMAPATWLELAKLTDDKRYSDYASKEFAATTDYLFDEKEQLYYRDSRFFDRRGPDGEKVFWSRGNGWVHAGLARMIPLLPKGDAGRERMESVFKAMSAALIKIQKPDGYWSPSLLADPNSALPESSGTAFFTYGLAWGIKAGLLDSKTYEPAVRKGWTALTRAVHQNGKFGYVQPVSDRPENVSFDDTQFYGVGAFLLAATAISELNLKPGRDLTVQAKPIVQAQAVLNIQHGGKLQDGRLQGGKFALTEHYTVPKEHFIHDGLMAFEGLGWESDLVAYRLYLDERMAVDIFGKKTPGPVLQKIGQGIDNYHDMADWGMDIFKVGETVGIGGIGRLRDGKAVQLGQSTISVKLLENTGSKAVSEVINRGLDQGNTHLTTQYAIAAGSALTQVTANATGSKESFVTGLIKHHGVTVLTADADNTGWAYIASWGKQSLANDELGIAVFYQPDLVSGQPNDDGASVFVTFKDASSIRYAFGIAWSQDRQGIKNLADFTTWLNHRRAELKSTYH